MYRNRTHVRGLKVTNKHILEERTGLIRVADILECLGRVTGYRPVKWAKTDRTLGTHQPRRESPHRLQGAWNTLIRRCAKAFPTERDIPRQ